MTKTTKLIIIGLLAMFLIWGHYAKQQAIADTRPLFNRGIETNLVKITEHTCEASYRNEAWATEVKCGQLADRLACMKFELFDDGKGDFWAEPNKNLICERNW